MNSQKDSENNTDSKCSACSSLDTKVKLLYLSIIIMLYV